MKVHWHINSLQISAKSNLKKSHLRSLPIFQRNGKAFQSSSLEKLCSHRMHSVAQLLADTRCLFCSVPVLCLYIKYIAHIRRREWMDEWDGMNTESRKHREKSYKQFSSNEQRYIWNCLEKERVSLDEGWGFSWWNENIFYP